MIRLVIASRAPGMCTRCFAALDWFETAAGRRMPMERGAPMITVDPVEPRRLGMFSEADVHWRTCPYANEFRRTHPKRGRP